jgi:hypothetical protein
VSRDFSPISRWCPSLCRGRDISLASLAVRKKFAPPKIEKCGNSWKRRKLGKPGPWRPWQVGLPSVFERIQCIVRPSKNSWLLGPGIGSSTRDLCCRACGGPKDFEDDFVC